MFRKLDPLATGVRSQIDVNENSKEMPTMADDPNKKHNDGWFVSNQPHEYQYFFDSIKKACSKSSDTEIVEAILSCRKAIQPSEGRAKLTECVKKKLGC